MTAPWTAGRVSAIIVAHNAGRQLLACIGALKAQTYPLHEIIVVDSGSTDGSTEAAHAAHTEVRVIGLGGNLGPCIARNRGAAAAASDLLLMIDDDVHPEPDCLRRLLVAASETGAAVTTPRLALHPERDLIQLDGAEAHFVGTMRLRHGRAARERVPPTRTEVGAFSTSCFLVEATAFRDAGGFDEAFFFHFEDLELSLRLRALGYRVVCEADALAFHDRGAGTPGLSFRDGGTYPRRRAYLTMRNRLQIIAIHYRLRLILCLAPALLLYELASLAFALRGRFGGEWLRAWSWQIRNLPSLLSRRRVLHERRSVDELRLLTGGPLPLAEGLLDAPHLGQAVAALSWVLDMNWRVASRLLGDSRSRGVGPVAAPLRPGGAKH